MSDNQNQNDDPPKVENKDPIQQQQQKPEVDVEKLVQERLDASLKEIKEKLDKAYSSRDEALKKVTEFENEKRQAELKRLQEEGKHKEAYEMQLAEIKVGKEAAEKRVIELTRDMELKSVLGTLNFRNDNALEMAYREIVGQLVQNEQGVWVHKSGVPVKDFVKSFSDTEENAFLFKPKVSSGSGSQGTKTNNPSGEKTSLFNLSQDEVLKRAREGTLRK